MCDYAQCLMQLMGMPTLFLRTQLLKALMIA